MEIKVSRKGLLWIGGLAAGAVLVLSVFVVAASSLKLFPREKSLGWNQGTIRVSYVGSQLREIDKSNSALMISYDLENDTDSDYRLVNGPGVVILSRLKSDGSFSQEQPVRLSYPVFLPARQHARLAIEITQPFVWPAEKDPAFLDKMKDFVKQRLENVGNFVLFDEANRLELELPSGWKQLQGAPQGSD